MASTYLSKTPSGAGNRKTFTFSGWFKRSDLGASNRILDVGTGVGDGDRFLIQFYSTGDTLAVMSGATNWRITSQVFRDVSAWYHIVVAVDTTQATAGDRIKIYVNGSQITSFGTSSDPSLNLDTAVNNTYLHTIGSSTSSSTYYDGSMAHVHLIDGTAYDASTFGETDATTGIWKPKTAPSVTYGTNGFFLKFENSGSMGTDSSGNANNFTVNGTCTQTLDTPSNVFATWNPLDYTGTFTSSNGNTTFVGGRYRATLGVSAGKYYWEVKRNNAPSSAYIGIKADSGNWSSTWSETYTIYNNNGNYYLDGSDQGAYGTSSTTNDILMFALDMDNGDFYIGENGTWYNSGNPATSTNPMASSISGTYLPTVINNNSTGTDSYSVNFGNGYFGTTAVSSAQNPDDGIGIFEYTVPTGYKSLCTKSLNSQEYD